MAQRRFGPTLGAGVVIIEEQADKQIDPAALGVTGYAGVFQKGRIGELIQMATSSAARAKIGSFIPESVAPDAIFDFFEHGVGAGEMYASRITDGTELTAQLNAKSRRTPLRQEVIQIDADNAGRWAGKRQTVVGQHVGVSNTTLSTGKTVALDEWKDGTLILAELPGRAFKILSNTTAGVITIPSDSTLADDLTLSGGGDITYAVVLTNEGKYLSVLFEDGVENPTTEWAMKVLEDGVLVKQYDNLSSDPLSARYFEKIVNEDDSNFYVQLTDLFTGTLTLDTRPANYAGLSVGLTATVLTANIAEVQVSAANGASAEFDEAPGSAIVAGNVLLTNTAAGTRPAGNVQVSTNPSDTDTLTLDYSPIDGITGTSVITFKTVVVDPVTEVLIGASAADTRDNLLAFLGTLAYGLGRVSYATSEAPASSIDVVGLDANDLLNATTEFTESGANFTFVQVGTGTPGVDQTWAYTAADQGDLPATVLTTGKPLVAPNAWLMGGTLHSTDVTDDFAIADQITIISDPFPANGLVGGFLVPDKADRRVKFQIISNTANAITVRSGSDMTVEASVGDEYIVQAATQLAGGYDGVAGVGDQDFIDAWSTVDSVFNQLAGKNKGLVKLASPGVAATAVLKAGAAYAEARNYQYRYEIPAATTLDESAEAFINDTVGRNDFAVVSFPSFGSVTDPQGEGGLKQISLTGMIHGREALIAKNFQGFHKAAAGIDVTLPRVLKVPTGERELNEELLNPQGINVIKAKEGNFIVWGDRTVSIDSAFRFKHQREYLSHIEHILQENFDFIIFAINNADTIAFAETALYAYFQGQFSIGAFDGASFEDGVRIKIDDEINTPLTAANGDLNAQIRLKIVNTVERFNITIGKAGIFEELA